MFACAVVDLGPLYEEKAGFVSLRVVSYETEIIIHRPGLQPTILSMIRIGVRYCYGESHWSN